MPTTHTEKERSELHRRVGERLSEDDHRYTTSRQRLVDALADSTRPLTLPDITKIAPDLAASSVYRNLEMLERAGVVRRINSGGNHAHFELAEPLISHHHHLVCTDCGGITDIHLKDELEQTLVEALNAIAQTHGFKPQDHNLDLHGACALCNEHKPA
ncbi:MAG: transcriptional repressor [Acidimicrobiia bacterium]|nr:transcriptional repressor [Acidimicrobiia bacterium]MCY4458140.1 Fur family transcriptional regulator [Acidimicrobiaceae bacterium]